MNSTLLSTRTAYRRLLEIPENGKTVRFPSDIGIVDFPRTSAARLCKKQWRSAVAGWSPPRRFHRSLSPSTYTHLVTRQRTEDTGPETIRRGHFIADFRRQNDHGSTLRWLPVLEVRLGAETAWAVPSMSTTRLVAPNRNKTCQGAYSRGHLATEISICPSFLP